MSGVKRPKRRHWRRLKVDNALLFTNTHPFWNRLPEHKSPEWVVRAAMTKMFYMMVKEPVDG